MSAKINVNQGCIGVNSVEVWRESEHALLVVCDLVAKRAEVFSIGRGNGEIEIWLGKNDETLHAGEGDEFSKVIVSRPDLDSGDWFVNADVGRYTLVIAAVKRDERPNEEDEK